MSKIHPAVGHFLTAAKELDLFDEALALISGGGSGGGKKGGKRHVSAETSAKIAAAPKRWSKEKRERSSKLLSLSQLTNRI